ncbi:MAG: sulfite exporter TauE/SafE family protein [Cetobacterium sp.]|uniref:sulfite exporter TauE/SafE family protein n=1 Tax=unclassified Cetobacterium TaxID=2630983 RepID=UPI00163C1929|nr:sulfite exporter TauE/SafE family protein [Cetobacterium sp. 2A]MBC2855684.1 sulfite exporter TauE/SafE family protein [Cetobacterium sp. 2A]
MPILDIILTIFMGIGIGFSVMGMSTSILYSPLMAIFYGARLANGIMFIPFFFANLYVAYKHRNNYNKTIVLKILPFAFLGMGLAAYFGKDISDEMFDKVFAILIIFVSIFFFTKKYSSKLKKFGWFFGVLGGASSYLANVAGPVFNIFLLSFNPEEKNFIGTRAFIYIYFNMVKLFLYIYIFKNINFFTISRALIAIPMIFVGIFLAKLLLKHIDKDVFDKIVIFTSLLIALKMLF